MDIQTSPIQNQPSEGKKAAPRRGRVHIPNLLSWIVGAFIALTLIGILFPVSNHGCIKGAQTKALAQAKQIGLALKLYAGDNNGVYPRQGVPPEMRDAPANSNQAFACLFPTYTQSEALFANKASAYQTRQPDEVIDNPYTGKPVKTLEPGENVYGYVMGLTEQDNPESPLVVDGTDGTGHYVTDPKKRGGVWKGQRAIVVHLDNSCSLETLVGPANARFIPLAHDDHTQSLLDAAYLRANKTRLLDPAVAARP